MVVLFDEYIQLIFLFYRLIVILNVIIFMQNMGCLSDNIMLCSEGIRIFRIIGRYCLIRFLFLCLRLLYLDLYLYLNLNLNAISEVIGVDYFEIVYKLYFI